MWNRFFTVVAAGVLAALNTANALAAKVDGTCTLHSYSVSNGSDVSDSNVSIDCPAFDSTLGTLSGIQWRLSMASEGSVKLLNLAPAPVEGMPQLDILMAIGYGVSSTFDFGIHAPQTVYLIPGDSFSFSFNQRFADGGAIERDFFEDYESNHVGSTLHLTGFVNSRMSGYHICPDKEPYCLTAYVSGTNTFSGSLTYTYEPLAVPELGTSVLFGVGLACLGLRKRTPDQQDDSAARTRAMKQPRPPETSEAGAARDWVARAWIDSLVQGTLLGEPRTALPPWTSPSS